MNLAICSLHFYPFKSCRAVTSSILTLEPSGPAWDRRFVLVDEGGVFLSQRTVPELATISVEVSSNSGNGMSFRLEALGMSKHFVLASEGESVSGPGLRQRTIKIHKDECPGIDLGDDHARWFSAFLKRPCRLVRQVSRLPRLRTPSSVGHEIEVSYADGFPLLVTTTASLIDLNRRIAERGGESVPMDRFRPNIVLSGCNPYDEDRWSDLKIGDVVLKAANKCVRCAITTTHQITGERGHEPLRTLASYRKVAGGGGVEFGRNFIVTRPGMISRGQAAEVLT